MLNAHDLAIGVEHLHLRLETPAGGARHAVLYFHGFGSDQLGEKAAFFRGRALAAGLAVASFDFRGHGRSGGTLRELTLTRNLADAALARSFLREQGYEEVVLVGSSMGALTALWHAVAEPEGLLGACLIAPALTMAEGFVAFLGEEGARRWERTGVQLFDDGERRCELGWELVADFRRYDRARLTAGYRVPSLILQGQLDDRVPWRTVQRFVEESPFDGLELVLYADGDHRLADRKERLWRAMAAFLERRGVERTARR
jgi:pimeloyl-ACP methyl ester carboxylesterase